MSRVRIDRGRIEGLDDEGRTALAARSGEYWLTPTMPDLMCLVRAEPLGGPAPSPRVVLAGDASGFPLSDLIAFLSQSRWSGVVRVHDGTGQRSLALKEGEVRGATSDNPVDRLGEVMTRLGFVRRDQVEQVLREHPPSRLGRVLVDQGVLQAHDLWKCITHQVSEIFHAMVLCREGTFLLLDQPPDEKSVQPVQLSMQSLLMDAIRKVDELAHFRKRIPHARMYVIPRQPSDGRLEPEEDELLAQVDGHKTLLDLAAAERLGEFDATKIVYRLLEGGYVQLSERPGSSQLPAATTAHPVRIVHPGDATIPEEDTAGSAEEVIRTFNAVFAEIRNEVASQGMEREFVAAANAALSGSALTPSPVLTGVLFDASGQLPADALLARFEEVREELGTEPVASLRQALSDVMFFLLFQAGELLESRQDEALARRVKELLAPLDGL